MSNVIFQIVGKNASAVDYWNSLEMYDSLRIQMNLAAHKKLSCQFAFNLLVHSKMMLSYWMFTICSATITVAYSASIIDGQTVSHTVLL